jgi:hypothetical protein
MNDLGVASMNTRQGMMEDQIRGDQEFGKGKGPKTKSKFGGGLKEFHEKKKEREELALNQFNSPVLKDNKVGYGLIGDDSNVKTETPITKKVGFEDDVTENGGKAKKKRSKKRFSRKGLKFDDDSVLGRC